jgi:hypothetical protein
MIPMLTGWTIVDEGDREVLLAKQGARLRYVERNWPVRSIADIAMSLVAGHQLLEIGPVEEHITEEGEYGGIVRSRLQIESRVVQRSIGVVMGDDFYSLLDATIDEPALFDAVHADVVAATCRETLGLGARPRRFRHDAPYNWHRTRRGIAESYERGRARVRVFPANPRRDLAPSALDALFSDLCRAGFISTTAADSEIVLASGLAGTVREATGVFGEQSTHHAISVLDDGRYLYVVREDAPSDEYSADAFRSVVESIEPLPFSRRELPDSTAAPRCFAYFAD